jgi:dihydroxyacetone kinase
MMQILISDNLILTQTDPLLVYPIIINNMGGIKSEDLNSLSKDIWNWCCDKNIWLSAAHIPGKCNSADIESRVFNDNVEWMILIGR